MYLIYVSKSTNVKEVAAIWGQEYETVSNSKTQCIHMALKKTPEWSKVVRGENMPKNPRIVRMPDLVPDHLEALNFTGTMNDHGFQVIGYLSEDDVDTLDGAYREEMIKHVDQIIDAIREDAHNIINEGPGVYDRVTSKKSVISFNVGMKVGDVTNLVSPAGKRTALEASMDERFPGIKEMANFVEL